MNTFEDLNKKVLKWADDKNLCRNENKYHQLAKVMEELGELSKAILKDNKVQQVDGIGDVLVTLCILSDQLNLDFRVCYDMAWNEIKDRTGKTIDGTFIKDETK